MSWQVCSDGSFRMRLALPGSSSGTSTMSIHGQVGAGVAVVDEQPVVLPVRDPCRGVRAARQVDRADELGFRLVADVEDVQALEAGRHELAVAERRSRRGRVPRADDDVLEDDDVTLVAVAERPTRPASDCPGRGCHDVEPVPVALDRELAPERDVGVDVRVPDRRVRRLAGSRCGPRGTRFGVLGSFSCPAPAASGNAMIPDITIAAKSGTRNNLLMSTS